MADTGKLFSLNQLLGKDMIAAKRITAYYDYPLKKDTFTINKGQTVGKLFSYIHFNNNTNALWFMFDAPITSYGAKPRNFYVKYEPGVFDKDAIIAQGAVSEEQKTEEKKREDNPIEYYIDKYGNKIILVVVSIVAIKEAANIFFKSKSNDRTG